MARGTFSCLQNEKCCFHSYPYMLIRISIHVIQVCYYASCIKIHNFYYIWYLLSTEQHIQSLWLMQCNRLYDVINTNTTCLCRYSTQCLCLVCLWKDSLFLPVYSHRSHEYTVWSSCIFRMCFCKLPGHVA